MASRYRESSDESSSGSSTELSEEEYEVEKLIGKRIRNGILQYHVKWVGYPLEEATWQTVEDLKCPKLIEEFEKEWKKKHPTPKTTKKRNTRSKSRSESQSSFSMDVNTSTSDAAKQKPATSTKSATTPSHTVKPKQSSNTSDSNDTKSPATPKPTPPKAPAVTATKLTPKAASKPSTPSSSTSTVKEKTGTSTKLLVKNPTGAREGMTRSQREFYESSADYFFISPNFQNSLFNNLVNQIEPSSMDSVPETDTIVKISKLLSKNPPVIKEDVSELANSILSLSTTVNLDGNIDADQQSATSVMPTTNENDTVNTIMPSNTSTNENIPPTVSTTASNTVIGSASTTTAADETLNTTTSDEASSINTEKEEEDPSNSRKTNANKKGAAVPAPPPSLLAKETAAASPQPPVTNTTKSKSNKKSAEQNNHLWNIATKNSGGEAIYGIVEGRPLSNNQAAAMSGEPIPAELISSIPDNHKCFGISPTIFEFAKNVVIHNVNNQKMESIFSKIWRIRCPECTDKYTVNDRTTEFLYCILSVETKNYFMIKLNKCESQLFLIDAEKFKTICSKKYGEFVCITREYFNTLGDLGLAIDEQKDAVKAAFDNPIMAPYKSDGGVNFELLKSVPPEVSKAVRQIGQLFFLELQMAIGTYMSTVVDVSELHQFVMKFYENRNPMFKIVRKEAVENIYETLFMSLVSEPADL